MSLSKIIPGACIILILSNISIYIYGYNKGRKYSDLQVKSIVAEQYKQELNRQRSINSDGESKVLDLNTKIQNYNKQIEDLKKKNYEQKAIIDRNNVITSNFVHDINRTTDVYISNSAKTTNAKVTAGGVVSASRYQEYIIDQFRKCNAQLLSCNALRDWIESTSSKYQE